jgi:hypothetical protein
LAGGLLPAAEADIILAARATFTAIGDWLSAA